MQKLLLYVHDRRRVTVLQSHDTEESEDLLADFGSDLRDWPEDLGAYKLDPGLWVWTGEAPEEDDWIGEFRDLNADELQRLAKREPIFE